MATLECGSLRETEIDGACHSCPTVREDMLAGQGTEQQCCPVLETLNVSTFPTGHIEQHISIEIE